MGYGDLLSPGLRIHEAAVIEVAVAICLMSPESLRKKDTVSFVSELNATAPLFFQVFHNIGTFLSKLM